MDFACRPADRGDGRSVRDLPGPGDDPRAGPRRRRRRRAGPPPTTEEAQAALAWLYANGKPPDSSVNVQFPGPLLVGPAQMHPNPPPDPWCVRCGYPDQGSSLMYPVLGAVTVTTTQGLVASALPPTSHVHVTTVTYNGTACRGEHKAEYCPTYFFYRDSGGRWRVAE